MIRNVPTTVAVGSCWSLFWLPWASQSVGLSSFLSRAGLGSRGEVKGPEMWASKLGVYFVT